MEFERTVRHHTNVPLCPASEDRVVDLCRRVIALPEDSDEFEPTMRELKATIHEQLEEARSRLTKMALIVAVHNQSQAIN